MRLVCYQSIMPTKAMPHKMAGVVACGLCLLAQVGLSLKYGAVVAMAPALVAANNRVAVAAQDLMLVKLFV